jgi:hypothetical protein
MVWRIKTINHRTTPAREREQTCATEAEFERAVKFALDWKRLISATSLTALSSMRVSYGGDMVQHNSLDPPEQQPRQGDKEQGER